MPGRGSTARVTGLVPWFARSEPSEARASPAGASGTKAVAQLQLPQAGLHQVGSRRTLRETSRCHTTPSVENAST